MTVYRLSEEIAFPPPDEADASGLLAAGGGLEPERLLLAYAMGIFPWYDDSQPILWHSPDPRLVLLPSELVVSRSLRKLLARNEFEIRLDGAFEAVIRGCAETPRKNDPGTWITEDMVTAYCRLFELGFAHSVEVRAEGELVGGLYGVSLGGCFFGESMFALRSDVSKLAFVKLVAQLEAWGFDLVDCQVHTDHLVRFGAKQWSRRRFLLELERSLATPTRRGRWCFDDA